MEYYSATKQQNNAICINMDATRDSHISEVSQKEKDKDRNDIIYMWNLIYGIN